MGFEQDAAMGFELSWIKDPARLFHHGDITLSSHLLSMGDYLTPQLPKRISNHGRADTAVRPGCEDLDMGEIPNKKWMDMM
jgi:hypothetical protein